MLFASFLSSQKGSARAARAQEDFIILKGKKRIAAVALFLRNDKATAYRTHLAAFVATKWCVILNAKRERIRNSHFKRKRIATAVIRLRNDGGGETDCHAPNGARNDRTVVNRTFYGGCNDRIISIVLICKLRIIKLCIKAVLFKQLLVRALLSHPAAVHNKYAVGVAYC